jgi:uncharacterized protein YprB with RNaseH-like and TPR domain
MALAPVARLTKAEIIKLAGSRCKDHRHTYLEHYACYLREHPEAEERIGSFDIEASHLKSDWGIMLSWALKVHDSDEVLNDVITPKDIAAGIEDKRIVQSAVNAICGCDKVVTYYGSRFDIPYIRSRALAHGIDFPFHGVVAHRDLYFVIRSKFGTMSSRRLENACRQILGSTEKTHLNTTVWRAALRGDKKALKYVDDHCRKDVADLERLYHRVIPFAKHNNASI